MVACVGLFVVVVACVHARGKDVMYSVHTYLQHTHTIVGYVIDESTADITGHNDCVLKLVTRA